MKENEVVEILEDGSVYYFDLDVCEEEAIKALESLGEKQNAIKNFDTTAAIFSLFVHSIYILQEAGWDTDELVHEVIQRTEEDPDFDDFDESDRPEDESGED